MNSILLFYKLFTLPRPVQHSKSKPNGAHLIAWQLARDVAYDGSYRQIDYPNGDVPAHIGVCTDVIIRSTGQLEWICRCWSMRMSKDDLSYCYPIHYKRGTAKVDPNIDHRRVHIIRKFLDKNYPMQSWNLLTNISQVTSSFGAIGMLVFW